MGVSGLVLQVSFYSHSLTKTSVVYKSPQKDMGYDISDYKAIDPIYGTIEDVDELIAELKKRGMNLMMDLVVSRLCFSIGHVLFYLVGISDYSYVHDVYFLLER